MEVEFDARIRRLRAQQVRIGVEYIAGAGEDGDRAEPAEVSHQRADDGIEDVAIAAPQLGKHQPALRAQPRVRRLHHRNQRVAPGEVETWRDQYGAGERDAVLVTKG